MFEPKREWADKMEWEDTTVSLKGMLKVKRGNYGRFVELAMGTGLREAWDKDSADYLPDDREASPRAILQWLGFRVVEDGEGVECVYFEDSGYGYYRDDMGQAVFAACAPAIEKGSVLAFMENWDEGAEEWPRIWRYTFDGEEMHRQEGRFAFDD